MNLSLQFCEVILPKEYIAQSSPAPLLLSLEGIIPRVGRMGISTTLSLGQRFFSLSLSLSHTHIGQSLQISAKTH